MANRKYPIQNRSERQRIGQDRIGEHKKSFHDSVFEFGGKPRIALICQEKMGVYNEVIMLWGWVYKGVTTCVKKPGALDLEYLWTVRRIVKTDINLLLGQD